MGGRFALIIGNSQYKDPKLPKLVTPAQDVKGLIDVLVDPDIGGFDELNAMLNRPHDALQKAIAEFGKNCKSDDLLLLYYSGHGLLDDSGNLYLATVDTEHCNPHVLAFPAQWVAEEMSSCPSKKQVLILDCCYAGAIFKGMKGGPVQPVDTENIFQGQGRTILAASDFTQFAFEGDAVVGQPVQSIFTRYLVQGLRTGEADQDRDGKVAVDEWYYYAYSHVVRENSKQTPVIGNTRMRGKLFIASVPAGTAQTQITKPTFCTWIVDPFPNRGDFVTISDAILKANPGDQVRVRPGVYDEALVIDKPLEIIGEGRLGEVVVRAAEKRVIQFQAAAGRIHNLTIRQMGGKFYAVNISQGRLAIEGCDISSQGLACVGIHDGATPVIGGNRIHDGKQAGIMIYENGQGLIEGNEIYDNAFAGIEIKTGGNPTVRGNRIHDGKQSGVSVYENGQGVIENNDIYGNANSGVVITTGGNPTVRSNRIHDGKQSGVYVYENGQGLVEDNDIYGNAFSGISIKNGDNPTVRCNRIKKNIRYGVQVRDKGSGIFERNVLSENGKGAWYISDDSKPNVKRTNNQEE